MGLQKLSIRSVALRDGLVMSGDHAVPAGGRHWRATASAFCIKDYSGTPMVWVEAGQVVGEMAAVLPKPGAAIMAANFTPFPGETLVRFEVIAYGGSQLIRSWWARGDNLHRTSQTARHEPVNWSTFPERCQQLARLMNWRA